MQLVTATTIPSVRPMGVRMSREQREEEITHELDFRPNFFSFLACQHSLETSLRNNPNGLGSSPPPTPPIPPFLKLSLNFPQGLLQVLSGCCTSALEQVQPAGGHHSSAGLVSCARLSDRVPNHSCCQGSSLNPISKLDAWAGIPALQLCPLLNSSGTRTLSCFCFHP